MVGYADRQAVAHNANAVPDTAQGDVMRWALPNGSRIRLSFARGAYERVARNPDGTAGTRMIPAKVDLLKKDIGDELEAVDGAGRVRELPVRFVEGDDDMVGDRGEEFAHLGVAEHRAGRVVRVVPSAAR